MRMPAFVKKHKKTFVVLSINVPILALLTWGVSNYVKDHEYELLVSRMINGRYFLNDSKILSRQSVNASRSATDAELHILLANGRAEEMISRDNILYDCAVRRDACPTRTWQPYSYYVDSYGKTYTRPNYQGKPETRNYNPAVANLKDNVDVAHIQCAMYQVRDNSAYSFCVNPKTGDLWYHYYQNWET